MKNIESIINYDKEFDSDKNNENESIDIESRFGKDGIQWYNAPFPQTQTSSRNILRQKPRPSTSTVLFTPKLIFKSIITKEMCDIILRETIEKNKKLQTITIKKLIDTFPLTDRPPPYSLTK